MSALLPQLAILPIVIPLFAGALLVLIARASPRFANVIVALSLAATFACALALLLAADSGRVLSYQLGNWPPPFGIALAVDRLAALMLVLVAIVAAACQLAALGRRMPGGPLFAALLQFQIMGLNGAFLTADLFNLFVFFEVLLIASYALLLHGAGRDAVRASLHYVVINLIGSALFLIAVSLLYGVVGTLNMADLAVRLARGAPADQPLIEAAVLLLLVVFGIKSAMLPLGFWLPGTYRAASLPVAVLFALMTKVGIYSILRVSGLILDDGPLLVLVQRLLLWGGIASLAFGALLVLAARDLRALTCALIAASAGTLLLLVGVGSPAAVQAALMYLPHTTLGTALLFVVGGLIADSRAAGDGDRLQSGTEPRPLAALAALFVFTAATMAGVPPFAGFVAKLFVLDSTRGSGAWIMIWIAVLGCGLALLIALSRAGSVLFWKSHDPMPSASVGSAWAAGTGRNGAMSAAVLLAAGSAAIVFGAASLADFCGRTSAQLADRAEYIRSGLPALDSPP